MKFKIDEQANIVTQDGKPVVIHDDGREEPYDVLTKISELNEENATRRHENKTLKGEREKLEENLNIYQELGSPTEIKTKLKKIEKGETPETKELQNKNASLEAQVETLNKSIQDKDGEIQRLNGSIEDLTIGTAFSQSKFIGEKTILDPGSARKIFGHHFRVEKDGEALTIVGYGKPNDERPLFSRNPDLGGAVAPFDEAMSIIFDSFSHKQNYVKGGQDRPGSNSRGNRGGDDTAAGIKLSDLRSDSDRAEFISKHGLKAFQNLVDASAPEAR